MRHVVYLGIFVSILSLSLACTSTPPREPAQVEDETTETPKDPNAIPNGPYDDCDQRALFEMNDRFTWVCTDNYVHIYPTKAVVQKNSQKIKIGSFNVYHLGDDQSRLKDFNAMAIIMNKWDLVGVTELMPLPTAYADENRKLREVMKENQQKIPSNWRVIEPGYYKLLKELQTKDSSWSLIFQPMPEGEGSTGELAGFFYRSSRVQLNMWNYCPQTGLADKINPNIMGLNFGCLAQVSPNQAKLMSRRAFIAKFKSGKFDFVSVVSHTRFRPASAPDQVDQQKEICSRYPAKADCAISKDKVGRFYEIKAVADQFPFLEAFEKDVLYMGDFNLDYSTNNQNAWNASIAAAQGYAVYQHENTSLSLPMEKLANSYDHFVLKAEALKECDLSSIHAYDFTKIGTPEVDSELKRLSYLLNPGYHKKTERVQTAFLDQQIRLERVKNQYRARGLTAEEKAKLAQEIKRSTVRLQNNKFWVLREYLSDHVPIEMTCNTRRDDD